MKITNICISNPYIEGFAYQENLITDYFKMAGLETSIIGINVLPKYLNSRKIETGVFNDNGKKIIRISCLKLTNEFIITFGLFKQLRNERPDVIFHHNLNCTSLVISTIYTILNRKAVLLVDNHADYINRSKNKFWQLIYYKFLVRLAAKFSSFFTQKFYGVTPLRCDYLQEVYGISKNKIDFLPLGADVIGANKIADTKLNLKVKFDLPVDSFVFVSGGKMGKDKGTDKLIEAINEINKFHHKVYLVLFGSFNDEKTKNMADESEYVHFKGWCNHTTSLSLLKLADFAVWPVHHTTLIEDAISVNTPILIRKTRTTEHLVEGNGFFLESEDYDELYAGMISILKNYSTNDYEIHCKTMRSKLSYEKIVEKVILDVTQESSDLNHF